jgi:hypothetical protein
MSKCDCGSNEERYGLLDAAGIFCCYVCRKCEPDVRKRYNPSIFRKGSRYAQSGEEEDLYFDEEFS